MEEDKYKFLMNVIKKAAFEASGKSCCYTNGKVEKCAGDLDIKAWEKGGRKRRNPVEWWDEECDNLVRDTVRASRAFRRCKCLLNQIDMKRYAALVRRAIRIKKKNILRRLQQG